MPWNNETLGIVGSSYAGEISGLANAIAVHEITTDAPIVAVFGGDGSANPTADATPLYDLNFATLWGAEQNVLTVLTISAIPDGFWPASNNAQFATNVANWLANEQEAIPEPASLSLLGAAILALLRRRR